MRKFGAALACAMLLATSACGGGGRPSTDDVAKALLKGGEDSVLGSVSARLDQKTADCIAQALVESKISDNGLRALVDGDKDFKGSKQDEAALTAAAGEMTTCMTAALTE